MEKIARNNQFSILRTIPQIALSGMHPDTKRIIEQINATKGKVLSWKGKNARDAKNRMDALKRAYKRKHVEWKEAYRKGEMLYFSLR